MKKRNFIRILSVACMLAMLLSMLVACKSSDGNTGNNGTGEIQTDLGDNASAEAQQYLPARQDHDGYNYRMLVQFSNQNHKQYYESAEGLNGDAISIALFQRAAFMEEYFNIDITVQEEVDTVTLIQRTMDADEDLWDVCMQIASNTMAKGVPNGHFIDLLQLEELNLEASYWDQRIQNDYAVNGMLFAIEGDFTVLDELRTQGILYNADIYEELRYDTEYGSPYELVRSGKWTYDTMLTMFKNTSVNYGGTDTLGRNDRWGMLSESPAPHVFFLGSGNKTASVVNGNVQLMFQDDSKYENCYNIIENILDTFYVNNSEVLFADKSNGVLSSSDTLYWGEISDMFKNDQALFRSTCLLDATWLGDMESRFGILPIPKYDETQEEYYCWVSSMAHMPLAMPRTVITHDHADKTAALTEALCYFSRYTTSGEGSLYDSFYEKMTVAKLCRTADDYKMLELIYASKTFDVDAACNFSKFLNLSVNIILEKNVNINSNASISVSYGTLSSSLASLRESAVTNLNTYTQNMLEKVIK